MKRSKKLLSLLLCFALLLGTIVAGVSVFAEEPVESTVLSYADLDRQYDNFVYLATEFYNSNNELLGKNATVSEGETLTCKLYYKTDYTMFKNNTPVIVFDNRLLDCPSQAQFTLVESECREISGTKKTVDLITYDFDDDGNEVELFKYADLIDGVTADEAKFWTALQLTLNTWNAAGTDDAGNAYAKNQVKANLKSDDPVAVFTVNVKDNPSYKDSDNNTVIVNEGFAKIMPEFYTCYYTTNKGPAQISIGVSGTNGYKAKADKFIIDADYNFTVSRDKTVTFKDGEDVISTATVAKGGKLTADQIPDTSEIEGFYKWADSSANFVENLTAITVNDNLTFYAVKSTETVALTLDPGDGYFGELSEELLENAEVVTDEETGKITSITLQVPITGFDISPYTPSIDGGAEFDEWVDSQGKGFDGTFSAAIAELSLTAHYGGGVVIKYLPLDYELEEVEVLIPVDEEPVEEPGEGGEPAEPAEPVEPGDDESGEEEKNTITRPVWKELFTYYGPYGEALSNADLISIQKKVNEKYAEINEGSGAADYGLTVTFTDGNNTASRLDASAAKPTFFKVNEPTTALAAKDINRGVYVFGESITALYINIAVTINIEVFRPTFDDEGNAIKDENSTYGFAWEQVELQPAYTTIVFPSATTNYNEDTGEVTLITYKNMTLNIALPTRSSIARKEGNENKSEEEIENIVNDSALSFIDIADIGLVYDKVTYKATYKDENGLKMTAGKDDKATRVLCKVKNRIDKNSLLPEEERPVDDQGNPVVDMSLIRVYAVLEDRTFHIGYNIDDYVYASDKEFVLGDTVDMEDIKQVARADFVIASYANENGERNEAAYKDHIVNTTDLYLSGTPVDKTGYELVNIYYNNADGEQVNINDGGTALIDRDFVTAYSKSPNADDYDDLYLSFNTQWIGKDYTFNLYYKNAKEEWKLLETKVFSGSEQVTYNAMVGMGSKLEKKIQEDCPSFLIPSNSGFSTEKDGSARTIFAYEADNETNSLDIYVCYSGAARYAFLDYNNAYDDQGNLNVDKVGETRRYRKYSLMYGSTLYDPAYDPEKAADTAEEPVFYGIMNGGMSIANYPVAYQKKDGDGNLMYEAVQEEKKDEEGNIVYNEDGTPVMVDKLDEEGNVVPDKEKPIMVDPKGSTVERPYRNCEFMGFKVYYVDGVYSAFEDLPDVSEWKEGYNDRNEKGAQHLYTTTIVQLQWKPDSDFLIRVYDDKGQLSFALGKDWKRYYWDINGNPCKKGENVLVEDRENNFCILITINKEEGNGYYLQAVSFSKTFLNMSVTSGYLPVILELVKGLI